MCERQRGSTANVWRTVMQQLQRMLLHPPPIRIMESGSKDCVNNRRGLR